jgi:hypothetical protein
MNYPSLFSALEPDCLLPLSNLQYSSYALIKQLILNQLFTVARLPGISSYRPEVSNHLPAAHGVIRAVNAPLNSLGGGIRRWHARENLVARMDLNHRSLGGKCHDQPCMDQRGRACKR